ncbi:unnamed protein product [Staurois parvus]|uniref:Uncharacterized protein n=1 Tax=Staurois parvus TaxID=386267 RepID=A0ABN9GCE5_9NEOB|nr:unnamed protein product [Staurois parvus]
MRYFMPKSYLRPSLQSCTGVPTPPLQLAQVYRLLPFSLHRRTGSSPSALHRCSGSSPSALHRCSGSSPSALHRCSGFSPSALHRCSGSSPSVLHRCSGSSPGLKRLPLISLHTGSSSQCVLEAAASMIELRLLSWLEAPPLSFIQGFQFLQAWRLSITYGPSVFKYSLSSNTHASILTPTKAF